MTFKALQELKKQDEARQEQSEPEQAYQPPALPAVDPAPEADELALPEPVAHVTVATRMLGAQVPAPVKNDFDLRVMNARNTYFTDLESREALIALVGLLDDDRTYRLWLHRIKQAREK